jgi:hypothetical protein
VTPSGVAIRTGKPSGSIQRWIGSPPSFSSRRQVRTVSQCTAYQRWRTVSAATLSGTTNVDSAATRKRWSRMEKSEGSRIRSWSVSPRWTDFRAASLSPMAPLVVTGPGSRSRAVSVSAPTPEAMTRRESPSTDAEEVQTVSRSVTEAFHERRRKSRVRRASILVSCRLGAPMCGTGSIRICSATRSPASPVSTTTELTPTWPPPIITAMNEDPGGTSQGREPAARGRPPPYSRQASHPRLSTHARTTSPAALRRVTGIHAGRLPRPGRDPPPARSPGRASLQGPPSGRARSRGAARRLPPPAAAPPRRRPAVSPAA